MRWFCRDSKTVRGRQRKKKRDKFNSKPIQRQNPLRPRLSWLKFSSTEQVQRARDLSALFNGVHKVSLVELNFVPGIVVAMILFNALHFNRRRVTRFRQTLYAVLQLFRTPKWTVDFDYIDLLASGKKEWEWAKEWEETQNERANRRMRANELNWGKENDWKGDLKERERLKDWESPKERKQPKDQEKMWALSLVVLESFEMLWVCSCGIPIGVGSN